MWPIFTPNTGNCGPEKISVFGHFYSSDVDQLCTRIWTYFVQCVHYRQQYQVVLTPNNLKKQNLTVVHESCVTRKISSFIFNWSFHLVGQPIHVTKKLQVSETDVNQLHQLYIQQLKAMYGKYKTDYSNYPNAELEIIWFFRENMKYNYIQKGVSLNKAFLRENHVKCKYRAYIIYKFRVFISWAITTTN